MLSAEMFLFKSMSRRIEPNVLRLGTVFCLSKLCIWALTCKKLGLGAVITSKGAPSLHFAWVSAYNIYFISMIVVVIASSQKKKPIIPLLALFKIVCLGTFLKFSISRSPAPLNTKKGFTILSQIIWTNISPIMSAKRLISTNQIYALWKWV